jgi:sugar lactone lactonase YvrE
LSSTYTTPCPPSSSTPFTLANTGEGGPANGFGDNGDFGGAGDMMFVDAYGNIYLTTANGVAPIHEGVSIAYAGGSVAATTINNASAADNGTTQADPIVGMNTLTATVGDMYLVFDSDVLRASSTSVDKFGNLLYDDHNQHSIQWIPWNGPPNPAYLLPVLTLNPGTGRGAPQGTAALPQFCYPKTPLTTGQTNQGYETTDEAGDGCPVMMGLSVGTNGGTMVADSLGNIVVAQTANDFINGVTLGTNFPATPIGQKVNPKTLVGQQSIDIHFDETNLPKLTVASAGGNYNFTTGIQIAPGEIPDFTINPIATTFGDVNNNAYLLFPYSPYSGSGTGAQNLSTFSGQPNGLTSPPICKQAANGAAASDASVECIVNVIFSPTAPGLRKSRLQVTTANGSVYYFQLTGIGVGGQLAIDGGAQQTVFTSTASTPKTAGVAVDSNGTLYIADPGNNQVVVQPAGGGTATTIGTGLKGPMGVAVDAAGNVYIADTGNNRIVEVAAITGAQTVLGQVLAAGSPAYPQYAFNGPQGIAVDTEQNVYVADTGNKTIVLIPSNQNLGPATPLFQYPGAPTFVNPVGVAVDSTNNIYIADTGNATGQIVKVPPGGGDLQVFPTALTVPNTSVGNSFTSPNGVAVDGGGDVFVSDSGTNLVYEVPSGTGPAAAVFPLASFTGLKSPSGLAVDQNGNVYLADSGNGRVLFDNRQAPSVQFGTVPQDGSAFVPACTTASSPNEPACTLTVTNIGTTAVTLASPFTTVSGTANAAFSLPSSTSSKACSTISSLGAGLTCTFTATFQPTADGLQSETVSVNGGTQIVTLTGTGEQPQVKLVLSDSPTTPAAGTAETVTATLTQPNIAGDTPTGAVTFSYTVDGGSAVAVTPVPMAAGSGGTSTASFTIPGTSVLAGHLYVVSATYQGDTLDSQTIAAPPLTIYVPGIQVSATAGSVTFVYGSPVPKITGTVTGIPAADASSLVYTFTTPAGPATAVGTYPIQVVFSGAADASSYGYGPFPPVFQTGSTTTPATVTETKATLSVTANNATTVFGAGNLTLTSVVTGTQNGDKFAETYVATSSTPCTGAGTTNSSGATSVLCVGTYSIVPTVEGSNIGNYNYTPTPGTLTVTAAPTTITVAGPTTTAPACSALVPTGCNAILASTALANGVFTFTVSTLVPSGLGIPTGTLTLYDTFIPLTANGNNTASLSAVAAASSTAGTAACGGTGSVACTTYTGNVPGGVNNGYLGLTLTVSGFTNAANNGIFVCIGSTATTVTLANTAGVAETDPGTLAGPLPNAPVVTTLPALVAGATTYTLTSAALGQHYYSLAYSGDANFQPILPACVLEQQPTAAVPCSLLLAPTILTVDNADFTFTQVTVSTGGVVSPFSGTTVVSPGVLPGGNAGVSGEQSGTPEQATVSLQPVLGMSGTVLLSCLPQNPSYVTCTIAPPSVTLSASSSAAVTTIIVSVSTPATLPLGFNFSTGVAFVPLGLLAFCTRRRRKLSKALWMLVGLVAISMGMTACGGSNTVAFFTPIPAGVQYVTVTATGTSPTTNTIVSRSFPMQINVQ